MYVEYIKMKMNKSAYFFFIFTDQLLIRKNNKMKQYLELLDHVLNNGTRKEDRTGTGTISTFGYQMRFNLQDGFPLLTTKKLHLKSIIYELLWFLNGDTNIKYLNDQTYGWFVAVFVFRIHPVDFMRQNTSSVGDMINSVHLILRLEGADYCIIKVNRLEYRCSDWKSEVIETVMTLFNKYTRK